MRSHLVAILRVMVCALAVILLAPHRLASRPQNQTNEQEIWSLEHAYWRYAQDNNLQAYLGLWHKDFLGWPLSNAAPVRKDHITDWLTSQTSKGIKFREVELKPASMQMNGNVAVVYYWDKYKWLDKNGKEIPGTSRITHTWLKDGNDWRIIGGMSMAEPQK